MFKIEDNIPFVTTRTSKLAREKQALINNIVLLKNTQSIFISNDLVSVTTLRDNWFKGLKKQFSNKFLELRVIDTRKDTTIEESEKQHGCRIWCNPENRKL